MSDEQFISLIITLAVMSVIGLLVFIAWKLPVKKIVDEYQKPENWGAK
jgi:hypothetical protein